MKKIWVLCHRTVEYKREVCGTVPDDYDDDLDSLLSDLVAGRQPDLITEINDAADDAGVEWIFTTEEIDIASCKEMEIGGEETA